MTPDHVNILGISYCKYDYRNLLGRIHDSVRSRTKLTIGYSHFFHAVLSRKSPEILDLYRKYDLVLPDGYGVFLAGKILYGQEGSFETNFQRHRSL